MLLSTKRENGGVSKFKILKKLGLVWFYVFITLSSVKRNSCIWHKNENEGWKHQNCRRGKSTNLRVIYTLQWKGLVET